MKTLIKIVYFTLFFTLITFAQTQISISLSNNLGTIGDRIKVKMILKTSNEADSVDFKLGSKNYELVSESKTILNKDKNFTIFEKNIFISFFKTGNFEVGPVSAELKKNGKTIEIRESNSVPITIKSILTEKDKDILPPKAPMQISGNPLFLLKYIFFIFLMTLIVFFIYRSFKKRKIKTPDNFIQIHPIDEFENKIKILWKNEPKDKKSTKKFFLRLSGIYKYFLTRYYNFNAEDMTSFEINDSLKRREKESLVIKNFLNIFLISDLVKFAKYIPSIDKMKVLKDNIDEVIMTVKKRREEEERSLEEKNVSPSK